MNILSEYRWEIIFLARVMMSVGVFAVGLFLAVKCASRMGLKSLIAYYLVRLGIMAVLAYGFNYYAPDISCWGEICVDYMLQGQVPGVDFKSVYYLGFLYSTAAFAWLFHSIYGLVVLFALFEFVALIVLYKLMVQVGDSLFAKRLIILYLASPFGFVVSWLGCQDEPIIMATMYALAFVLLFSKSKVAHWFIIMFGIACSKILILLYLFPVVIIKRFKGFVILLALFALYSLVSFGFGLNPVKPEGLSIMRTLDNPWYILRQVSDVVGPILFVLLAGLVSMSVFPAFYDSKNGEADKLEASMLLSSVLLLFAGLTQKTFFSPYHLPIVPFLLYFAIKSSSGAFRVLICVWLTVFAWKDTFVYGYKSIHIMNVDILMAISSVLCMVLTIAVLMNLFIMKRELFYAPGKAFLCLFKPNYNP